MFFSLFLLMPAGPVVAQEGVDPSHIYEAYYQVNYADMPEWNRIFNEHAVPVLQDLQTKGVIQGWSQWQHQTGGEYNIRFTARTHDWGSINTFWSQYLPQVAARSAEDSDAIARMIKAHHDEIWDVAYINVPEGLETAYMYAATYRHSFADSQEWNRLWNEVAAPVINQAQADGLLGGWVQLTHNTGGSHNYKVLYLFQDWDHMDDFFQFTQSTMMERHPEEFQKFGGMIQAHDDIIWAPAPREGM
jgi:hypothetical protein